MESLYMTRFTHPDGSEAGDLWLCEACDHTAMPDWDSIEAGTDPHGDRSCDGCMCATEDDREDME